MINKFKESQKRVAALTFGRMNPMTTGHMLVCKKLHDIAADAKFVYLSHSQDKPNKSNPLKCKNPLPYDVKFLYVNAFIKDSPYNDVQLIKSEAKTILQVLNEIYQKGYTDIIVMVGSDRVDDFEKLVNKYNNYINNSSDSTDPMYSFSSIQILSAGERDEESGDNIAAMSASKMRRLAVENNFEEFRKGVPTKIDDFAKDLYEDVRYYMGIDNYKD